MNSTAAARLPVSSGIDSKAFEILVRQQHRRLLAYALALVRREDVAEDLVQEAFVTAYGKLDQFDAERDFGAWMRGIVKNKFREWSRRREDVALDDELFTALEARHDQWETTADHGKDIFITLRDCLEKLPELLHRTVDCFYLQRLSGADVATKLDCDEAAVRKRLQRARQQLGTCIKAELGA